MLQDLKYAVRVLLQSKLWTTMVVLLLGLGIGANAAIFSSINGLLLRKIPVDNPDQLVRLLRSGKNDAVTNSSDYGFVNSDNGQDARATFSYPMYQQFVKDNQTMIDLVACAPMGQVNLVTDGNAEIATTFGTSGNYYSLLGVKAFLGRIIVPDDDRPGAPPVAVISYPYWERRFGRDPNVVGKVVQAAITPVTIVGVLDPKFTGIQSPIGEAPNISFPLALDSQLTVTAPDAPPRLNNATNWWLQVVGRLKPGSTRQQVLGNLAGVFQSTARANMDAYLWVVVGDGSGIIE